MAAAAISPRNVLRSVLAEAGAARQMVWIPEEHAVVGRFLRLTKFGVSEDGWEVVGVGARLPEEPEFYGR